MKNQKSHEQTHPPKDNDEAPAQSDATSAQSSPEPEEAITQRGAAGAAIGGLVGGAGGAFAFGTFGIIDGVLREGDKKSRW